MFQNNTKKLEGTQRSKAQETVNHFIRAGTPHNSAENPKPFQWERPPQGSMILKTLLIGLMYCTILVMTVASPSTCIFSMTSVLPFISAIS